jgi:hypothetical protein
MFIALLFCFLTSYSNSIFECEKEILITDNRLGEIEIGESIIAIKAKFPTAIESYENSEGVRNKNLKYEDSCGYILFRFERDVLTAIRTNHSKVYTKSGLKIGDKVSDILVSGAKIEEYESLGGELLINIIPSHVKFYLNKEDTSHYFSDGGDFDLNIDPNYKINEFIVRKSRQ